MLKKLKNLSEPLVLSISNEARPLQTLPAARSTRYSDCIEASEIMHRLHYPSYSHVRQL
jgi:hypothetical protein